ncbi:hypothetical protein PhCBS80983_g04073 [Powellomyces hirtus]|uniref:DUF726 domain-containing protein n=1 Tax=Powellomyces hirtus TaxID=109895 RepID=A0A507DZ56_9FUNG|nr:hypothetical protein PhCBS80983_g04073 [Powellomyces hirtus]
MSTGHLPGNGPPNVQPRSSSLVELDALSEAPEGGVGTGKQYQVGEDLLFAYISLVWLLAQREQEELGIALTGKRRDCESPDKEVTHLSPSSSLTSLTEEEQIEEEVEEPEKPFWGKMKSFIVGDAEAEGRPPALSSYHFWKQELVHGLSTANGLKEKEQDLVIDTAEHGVTIESMTKSLASTFRNAVEQAAVTVAETTEFTQDQPASTVAPTTTSDTLILVLSNLIFSSLQESMSRHKELSYDARLRVLLYKLAGCMYSEVVVQDPKPPADGESDVDKGKSEEDLADMEKARALMVQEVEHNVAQLLWEQAQTGRTNDPTATVERTEEATDKWKRWAGVGLATVGGGVVIGLTGGLAAPLIGAGLGSVLTGIGLGAQVGLVATLGTTAGVAMVGTFFGVAGGGLTAYRFNRRLTTLSVFEFRSLTPPPSVTSSTATSQSLHLIIPISGWLLSENDITDPWSILPAYTPFAEITALAFDPHHLLALGTAFQEFMTSSAVTYGTTAVLKQTVLAGLVSALVWPVGLLQIGYLVDNPWTIGLDRAKKAGVVLANDVLAKHIQGRRPVTLIGWSLGARVIYYCLLHLAKLGVYGAIDHAFLLGTPVGIARRDWCAARSVVAGRLVNVYSTEDWLLGYLFRATEVSGVAGLSPVSGIHGLENVDVSSVVKGHLKYKDALGEILDLVGFERRS